MMVVDLVVAVMMAVAWLAAGIATATGKPGQARVLVAVALLATALRVVTAAVLLRSGWWFVEEKVLIGAPLLGAAVITALLTLRRGRTVQAWSLLTCGYAATAGLLATVLIGYPATVAAGLGLIAATGLASLLTAMLLGLKPPVGRALGVLAAVLLLIVPLIRESPPSHDHPQTTIQRGPDTPAPGGSVVRFFLTAQKSTVELASGKRVPAWTFDGQVPGPALVAQQGDLLEVTLRNRDIDDGVTLHWHGYDVPMGEDGVPGLTQDAVAPGRDFVYRFRALQTGTYWYHTHSVSDPGVRMGLYGTLVVRAAPVSGVDFTLAAHTLAGVAVVNSWDTRHTETVAAGTPVRLRLINTDSNPHTFRLAGTKFRVSAIDGGELSGLSILSDVGLRIPAGGRYDITFEMPQSVVLLRLDALVALRLGGDGADPEFGAGPEFDPLSYGVPNGTPVPERFDRDYTLVLDRGLVLPGGFVYTINGRIAPDAPMQTVRRGDLVRFTVVNRSLATHPWHLHGHHVLVLSRDGVDAAGSPLWLDTFDVRPGEVWQVAVRADNPGVWMNHCHNLSHAEEGMASHLAYVE